MDLLLEKVKGAFNMYGCVQHNISDNDIHTRKTKFQKHQDGFKMSSAVNIP